MLDLKEILMNLGNKLVLEHGYEPACWSDTKNNTSAIKDFTVWMNEHPDAQEVLRELGFNWSM
jgi:hypothetical protein